MVPTSDRISTGQPNELGQIINDFTLYLKFNVRMIIKNYLGLKRKRILLIQFSFPFFVIIAEEKLSNCIYMK